MRAVADLRIESLNTQNIMKISKETWKDILKIVGTIVATIASMLGVQAMPPL